MAPPTSLSSGTSQVTCSGRRCRKTLTRAATAGNLRIACSPKESLVSLVEKLKSRMSLPVIAAPMFIVSNPDLVIAQCVSGVVGSFPALNARPAEMLESWIETIETALEDHRRAHPGPRSHPSQ